MSASRARRARGFTLTELAVVFAIVALLLAAGLYTLSAQTDVRNFEETRRRLELARELVLAFALVNGRLPCPATASGAEAITTPPNCDASYGGFLPAQAIGFQIVDGNGFAIDAWGNRIRYAVSSTTPTCTPAASAAPHFTNAANLRTNGITCQPNDLVVCASATGITATACGTATPVSNQTTLVALLFSTGKNGVSGSAGIDEAANVNGDRVFVWHTPTPAGATNGEFDDQMTWITVGELYSKLVAAGLLP
ncbi:MAG: type II secretion system GspH family protein [Betaproteobacteria bacterium]|nr:type II secretion system GspH family protein [Betaproteobacteria bacterium]MDH5349320.1 type II secretion system GspH family protein [Betaproteobacteria bacterium]